MMKDALRGVRVLDLSVNAPGPFASLILADLGAEVTVVVNPRGAPAYAAAGEDAMLSGRGGAHDALARGKTTLPLDLKTDDGRAQLLARAADADVLMSEMRPGKLESLGIGWEVLSARNPRLILCEITGFGRRAARATRAAHDINYLALSGALSLLRDADGKPRPPQNMVADYGGGGLAATGILAALYRRAETGKGAHITLSLTDSVRYLISDLAASTLLAGVAEDDWRATLSGGMPTYDTYRTADGQWMAVGALEPKFIALLAAALQWDELPALMASKATWQAARDGLAERFAGRPRAEWEALFADSDACVTPVLSLPEAGKILPTLPDVLGDPR